MSMNQPERIELTFDLHDLPTAQHRAGLAGMLLLIESMKRRKTPEERIPQVVDLSTASARIAFTQDSIQGLFDDLYDADPVEIASPSKWKGATPKHETTNQELDVKTGKMKTVKRFVYDVVRPKAPWLEDLLSQSEDNPWLKLWRDMVWAIPRGINTTRVAFNSRARREPCPEAESTWNDLLKAEVSRTRSQFVTSSISGALMLSAQAVNAEGVPFTGRVEHNLLLHFWQVVVMTYVPQFLDDDGKAEAKGYVLAIPDVSDLCEFLPAFSELISQLDPKRRGFRPASSLLDIPAQSSLEFLRGIRELAQGRAERESWKYVVSAVESFHMLKLGNNSKLLAFDRVANRPALIGQYEAIVRSFRNPLFRAARMRALLRDQPWYSGMLELFSERPWPFFVECEKTPRFLPRFGGDAKKQFRGVYQDTRDMSTEEMSDDQRLARIVQRLINRYVEGRAEAKTGMKVKTFDKAVVDGKERVDYKPEFREAQQRVCSDAFLAMRSRHDQDFVAYFAGSICSVAQFLPPGDYKFLTGILLTRQDPNPVGPKALSWEDVKALAMIAVSASSFFAKARDAVAS